MSQPELLRFALARHFKRLGVQKKLDGGLAMARWADAVGPHIASRAQAESFSDGTLTVVVPDATWRHELSLSRERLIEELNTALGHRVVREIFFVASSRRKDR